MEHGLFSILTVLLYSSKFFFTFHKGRLTHKSSLLSWTPPCKHSKSLSDVSTEEPFTSKPYNQALSREVSISSTPDRRGMWPRARWEARGGPPSSRGGPRDSGGRSRASGGRSRASGGGPAQDGGRLYAELLPQVFQALLPAPLVEDAEHAAGPPAVLQGPGAQGAEQGPHTAVREEEHGQRKPSTPYIASFSTARTLDMSPHIKLICQFGGYLIAMI